MKSRLMILAVIFTASIAVLGCSSFGSSKTYYGVSTVGKHIVFIVDISGSMEGKNEGNISDKVIAQAISKAGSKVGSTIGGRLGGFVSSGIERNTTKLAKAKRELGPAIRGLDENTHFTIVTFSNGSNMWKTTLEPATSGNRTLADVFVERLSANGGTDALKGLQAAFRISGADTIFFLSDGYPTDANPSAILSEVSKMNRSKRIIVHSIGLGDQQDEQFLRQLAEQNGGSYSKG